MRKILTWSAPCLAASVAGGLSGSALAQGTSAQASVLEEITVTARRREESLQDLPLSIAAMTADDMQTQGIYYTTDLGEFIPSVTLNESNRGQTLVFIRGIGGGHPDAAFSWGSGIYVDGHYVAFSKGGYMSTMDIERIEVLRGPQGTLFGRNTTGGAVNIISTKPQPDFESSVTARVGDFGQQDLRAMVNFAMSDNAFARLSAASEQSEGYYYNTTLGRYQGDTDHTSARAAFRFLPGNWTIDTVLSSEKQRDDDTVGQCAPGPASEAFRLGFLYGEAIPFGPQTLAFAECNGAAAQGPYVTTNELDTYANVDIDEILLSGVWNAPGDVGSLENVSVTMTYSFRDMENRNILTGEYTSFPIQYVASPVSGQNSETTSYEVLFEADANDRLSFLLGANYFENRTDNAEGTDCYDFYRQNKALIDGGGEVTCPYDVGVTLGLLPARDTIAPGNTVGPRSRFLQAQRYEDSTAFFAHMTYALNDLWDLELGARYTEDKAWNVNTEFPASNVTIPDPQGCCVYDRILNANLVTQGFISDYRSKFSATTPMISLTRSLDAIPSLDNGMIYFLISRGYLTGGVNTEIPVGSGANIEQFKTYDPEYVTNYEMGFKGTFSGGRLRLNSDVFYMDYSDKQQQITLDNSQGQYDPGGDDTLGVFDNAGKVAIYGVEIELTSVPWDGGNLAVNLGYLNSEYKEWSTLNELLQPVDLTAADLASESPEWTLNASVQHTFQLGNGGTLTPMLGVYYQSELDWTPREYDPESPDGLSTYYGDIPGNLCWDDGYSKWRARLTYDAPGGGYSVSLFGSNITDEQIIDRCAIGFGLFERRLERPSAWGLEFTARWGND